MGTRLATKAPQRRKEKTMKPGMGVLIFGIVLLVAGVGVTMFSGKVVWYGAMIVGVINIVRGIMTLSRAS
jgi:uncharacterized membrane protein HdeD (DUF308 family)